MAKKKSAEFEISSARGWDKAKLQEELVRLKKEQFNLRFQRATGQLEKPSRIRDVRRDIARVQTVLREKQPAAKV